MNSLSQKEAEDHFSERKFSPDMFLIERVFSTKKEKPMKPKITPEQVGALQRAYSGAWSRAEVWTIVCPLTHRYGFIRVVKPISTRGIVRVWVWDFEGFSGYAQSSGYVEDKVSDALSGIKFEGEIIEKAKGMGLWKNNLSSRGYLVIKSL